MVAIYEDENAASQGCAPRDPSSSPPYQLEGRDTVADPNAAYVLPDHETMAERVTFVYLAVSSVNLPPSAGYVRGSMIFPSFDIITREPSGQVLLHHFITCHLKGTLSTPHHM